MRTYRVITTEGEPQQFIWLLVTDKAKRLFSSGVFDLYAIYDDDSESLIETYEDLNLALKHGLDIGVGVGHFNLKNKLIMYTA